MSCIAVQAPAFVHFNTVRQHGVIMEPNWSHALNRSIKNAPNHLVQRLRQRAKRHHRSLQGELLAIIEAAAEEERPATPTEVLAEVRRLGLRTPGEAAGLIRDDRDRR
jgi:plasmid stability protein